MTLATRLGPLRLAALAVVGGLALVALPSSASPAAAQEPSQAPSEAEVARLDAQQLAIEQQLLCPQCTNKRLDVCELAICNDMRRMIRDRLERGDPPDDIIHFFRVRYGDHVVARIPREGFNLVLFGWVGGSMVLVAAVGSFALWRMRTNGSRTAVVAGYMSPEDDAFLESLEAARDDDGGDEGDEEQG